MPSPGGADLGDAVGPQVGGASSRAGRRLVEHPSSPYLATTLLTSAVVTLAVQLWKVNLRVPFNYAGDAGGLGHVIPDHAKNRWSRHRTEWAHRTDRRCSISRSPTTCTRS